MVDSPTRLQRLILDRIREKEWTPTVVARRGGLPESTVHSVIKAQQPNPTMATLRRLAVGLELPIEDLARAAGYVVDGSGDLEHFVRLWVELPVPARHLLVRMAQRLLDGRDNPVDRTPRPT